MYAPILFGRGQGKQLGGQMDGLELTIGQKKKQHSYFRGGCLVAFLFAFSGRFRVRGTLNGETI